MGNSLAENALKESAKNGRDEPGIRETNWIFMLVLLTTAALMPLSHLLFRNSAAGLPLGFAIFLFFLGGMAAVFGWAAGKDKIRNKRILFPISYFFTAGSLSFAMCSVIQHLNLKGAAVLNGILISSAVIASVALIVFLILSAGRLERVLTSLVVLISLAIMIAGIAVWTNGEPPLGVPLTFAGVALFCLSGAMCIYVFSGSGFYECLALAYFIVALIGIVIALVCIAGDCDCDCGGADCSPSGGGRRNKLRKR